MGTEKGETKNNDRSQAAEKLTVFISIPTTGWIHKHCCFVSDRLLSDGRYKVKLIRPTHNPYENNLHHIMKQFLEEGYDFWLSFDSDNPPINNPLDLVGLDKDIIGCPTPVWYFTGEKPGERPYYWNVYDYVLEKDAYKEHLPHKGLQRVDAIGTGCFLAARRVFIDPEMQKAPFNRQYLPDGRVGKGNDISFSERARKNYFEIWAHYDYPCRHFVELELTEVIRAFGEMKRV